MALIFRKSLSPRGPPKLDKVPKEEADTPELGKVKLTKNFTFNENNNVIEPYNKSKPTAKPEIVNKNSESPPTKEEEEKAKVKVSDILGKEKPGDRIPKKRHSKPSTENKITYPKYEPLPCLECKNIKSVCEALKVDKLDDVISLVNSQKHGKLK